MLERETSTESPLLEIVEAATEAAMAAELFADYPLVRYQGVAHPASVARAYVSGADDALRKEWAPLCGRRVRCQR